jgi:hypothetical protein
MKQNLGVFFLILICVSSISYSNQTPSAVIVESGTQVSGEVQKEAVIRVLNVGLSKISHFYQDAYKKNLGLWGYMGYELTIDDKGEVTDRHVLVNEAEGDDKEFTKGLLDLISSWRYPKPPKGQIAVLKVLLFVSDWAEEHQRIPHEAQRLVGASPH